MIEHRRGAVLPPLFFLLMGGVLLACPKAAGAGFERGLALCVHSLAPALFPFFVVSALVTASPGSALLGRPLRPLCRLYGATGETAPLALLLSWLGGYTVCLQVLAEQRAAGRLTAREADRLAMLGFCSGPGFVVGCVGGLLLGSARTGAALYLLQLAANLPAAALLAPLAGRGARARSRSAAAPCGGQQRQTGADLAAAVNGSVSALLSVCGCVLFFCVLSAVLEQLLPLSGGGAAAMQALFEVTAGCSAFAGAGGVYALYGVGLCLSLPGLSVLAQAAVLARGQVSLPLLAASRGLHAVVFQGLLYAWARLAPGALTAVSTLAPRVVVLRRGAPDAVFLLFCFLCTVLYKAGKRPYN